MTRKIILLFLIILLAVAGGIFIFTENFFRNGESGQQSLSHEEKLCQEFIGEPDLFNKCQETVVFVEDSFPGTMISIDALSGAQPEGFVPPPDTIIEFPEPIPEEVVWSVAYQLSEQIVYEGENWTGVIRIFANKEDRILVLSTLIE